MHSKGGAKDQGIVINEHGSHGGVRVHFEPDDFADKYCYIFTTTWQYVLVCKKASILNDAVRRNFQTASPQTTTSPDIH